MQDPSMQPRPSRSDDSVFMSVSGATIDTWPGRADHWRSGHLAAVGGRRPASEGTGSGVRCRRSDDARRQRSTIV